MAAWLWRRGRDLVPQTCPHRFRDRKTKRRSLSITRYATSRSKKRQRKGKSAFRAWIARAEGSVEIAEVFCQRVAGWGPRELEAVGEELEGFLPWMKKVVSQARRAKLEGEQVPAAERVYSLFEPPTELIQRGRREKPVEFGDGVLLCQTREKCITDYEAFAEHPADGTLSPLGIERPEKLFGQRPKVLAANEGFCPDAQQDAELAEQVETLAIPRRMQDFADQVLRLWQEPSTPESKGRSRA